MPSHTSTRSRRPLRRALLALALAAQAAGVFAVAYAVELERGDPLRPTEQPAVAPAIAPPPITRPTVRPLLPPLPPAANAVP